MTVSVLVELSNRNIDKTFSYNVKEELIDSVKVGKRVTVPFGKQKLEGFILEVNEGENPDYKYIIDVVDEDIILNDELLDLGKFLKKKTLSTLISCYQAMLPKALKAKEKVNINKSYDKYIEINVPISYLENIKLTPKQKLIIEKIQNGNNLKKDLLPISSVKSLIDKKIVREVLKEKYRYNVNSDNKYKEFKLNEEQENAVSKIINGDNDISVLYGVTGSGKTEVYIKAIEHFIKEGKSAIVLVPEISLTPQTVKRFVSRLGNNIAVLHSRLSEGEKYDEYRKIAKGEVKIVIGARSAVFAPLKNIGIIIIDEEHSTTYKQESNPKYNTIDVAIERIKNNKAKLVLGSATPTIETFTKAYVNKYQLVELKKRANNMDLPLVEIVDMNENSNKGKHFSKQLIEKIQEKLEKKEQIILLLNRRGYASFITCSSCGYVSKCPNCDVTLTYHKTSDMERCHMCGYASKKLEVCPKCHEKAIKNLGMGTEKIEEELNTLFKARIIRMDFDTTSKKGAHEKIITAFKNYEYDILLGTQMIAKGLDFPLVTLVGVINADTSLFMPNIRSSEYTFDLLSQVAGRCGRGDKKGNVIIQTFNKDHYAISLAKNQNYIEFWKREMQIRKELFYPPYSYMVLVKVMSKDYELAKKESTFLAQKLKENLLTSKIVGPSIGNNFKINNIYRFSIIIKYKKEDNLYPYLEKVLDYYKSNVKIKVDVDFNTISV